MVDSTEAPVLEEALKRLGGRAAINSMNLENGLERPREVLPLAKRYNAAVVALTIDEEGMARTAERKVAIARRMYDLAVDEYGLAPTALFFDALTLPVSTGIEEDRRNALETVAGVRRIKAECPGAYTVLGVSNVSFGLKPAARHVLNSVFLHECVEAGLDAAIVHAGRITPLYKIDEEHRAAALDLIYDRREGGHDPLTHFVTLFEAVDTSRRKERVEDLPLEEELQRRIVDGDRNALEPLLDQALERYDALAVINDHLLAGMATVGELFASGEMQLPFVLQSAEVMKAAVAYLEPHMDRSGVGRNKGTLVLATVRGDVHDIGKNLVDIILSNNGFKVVNLGIKQPVGNIIEAALQEGADAIGMSGLLVKSTLVMRDNLVELNERGLDYFPVLLGGAALTRSYVEEDLRALYHGDVHYGQDAFEGLAQMNRLCSPEARQQRRERIRSGYATGGIAMADEPAPPEEPVAVTKAARVARSEVAVDVPVPAAPFLGSRVVSDLDPAVLFDYINPLALYGGQFRLRRRAEESRDEWWSRISAEAVPAVEAVWQTILDDELFQPAAVYGYLPCNADGDTLVVYRPEGDAEWVRFTFPRQRDRQRLCLADYFRPLEGGEHDVVAWQLVTLGNRIAPREQELFGADRYTDYLYLHGLAVESAEALAEYLHQRLRRELGIEDQDDATVEGLFRGGYRGARYSFGYPACPRLEDHVLLFELLDPGRIGVELSEEFQLVPEVSTAALVVHHPEARYFSVMGEDAIVA
jgi:5-methyltetrahydrofolate--homocysteine methyltransferase